MSVRLWLLVLTVLSTGLLFIFLHIQSAVPTHCWEPGDFWLNSEAALPPLYSMWILVSLQVLWLSAEVFRHFSGKVRKHLEWLVFVPVGVFVGWLAVALIALGQMIDHQRGEFSDRIDVAAFLTSDSIYFPGFRQGEISWHEFRKREACAAGFSPRELPDEMYDALVEEFFGSED